MTVTVSAPVGSGNPAPALPAECAPYPAYIIQHTTGGKYQVVPAPPGSDGRPVASGLDWDTAFTLRQRLNARSAS